MKKLIKRKYLLIVLAIVIVALAVAGSYSWFVATDSDTFVARIKDPAIVTGPLGLIEKTSSANEVLPSESFAYSIKASNSADATEEWKGVTATDILDSNLSFDSFVSGHGAIVTNNNGTLTISFGDIAIGEFKEVTIYVHVSGDAEPGEVIRNSVSAKGSNDPVATPVTAEDPNPPVVVTPVGTISKSASADIVQAGQNLDYTITVTNSGTAVWKNVTATDDLNASGKLGFVSSSTIQGNGITISESGGVVTMNFGDIAAGETKIVKISTLVKAGAAQGTLENTVTAVSDNHATVDASYPVTVIEAGGYITKRASTSTVIQGGTYTYTITAGNNDPATWENVVATDTLDTSLITFTGYTSDQGVTVNNNNGVLTINFGDIASGATKSASINVSVNWGVTANIKIANTVTATGSDGESKTGADPVRPAVLGTTLSVRNTSDRSGTTREGDTIVYSMIVKNEGNAPLYDVVVNSVIPEGLTLVPGSVMVNGAQATYTLKDGVLSINIGDLAPGESVTVTYSAIVTANAIDRSIESTGTATGYLNKYHGSGDTPDVSIRFTDQNKVVAKPGLISEHLAYIIGYSDGTVRPENNISRAEATTIVFRLLTSATRNHFWSKENNYSDVNSGNWFNNAVSTMTESRLITGYTDGTFKGNSQITRAEFAVILDRLDTESYTGSSIFSDVSGHWAEDYINRAAAKGLINGYTDGTFRPDQNITRAEAMTMVNRKLGRAHIAEMHRDMVKWPDNPTTAWYYSYVQEATNSHIHSVTNEYEYWTSVLEPPNWAELEKAWSQANS